MSYHVKFNDITSMHGQTNQTIQQWGESITNLSKAVEGFAGNSSLQGKAMTSAQTYMREVHGTLLQTFLQLMNDYSTSLLLYKDGYYQIDTHNHAELPENVYKGLHSDLGKSKQRFEHQSEQLTAAKLRVAGLVNYQGTSHTKTKFTYEKLMKDIQHLDESITQYEEMHARQDLQAFKELLDATKSLIAEHSSRNRSLESYQSGAFGKLPSVQRFMVAYEQVTAQLNDRMGIIQAALERDQVRMEALHAEERTKQGLMNLVFGVLTVVAGASALVMSGGTMLPIVTSAFKVGAMALSMYGASNSIEAGQNIYYGLSGDGKSFAVNPIRDTLFLGNGELYHSLGQIFSLTTGVFIPIAQTQSIAQGISQFFWGTVGALATGQAAYHGTKLLGGNEETAQLMNLLGNFVGGYKFSKIAENFSLNTIRVPKVESAPEIKNRVLENIEASKAARESSKFDNYLRQEYAQQGKYFPERIIMPNGKKAYLSADYFEGKQIPVRSRSFVDAQGKIKWPPKGTDGFVVDSVGNPITERANLKAGQVIDRFGSNGGRFASPVDNEEKLPFNTRGLPYPEDHQVYHQYEIVRDLTKENILQAFKEAPDIVKEKIRISLEYYGLDIEDLANIRKGKIAKVFGQGGGTQIQFASSLSLYEDLGLVKEIK
ncbi:T7SS effector LXG polymorphic toxin [Granulicatella adiacens ATCC 49175]|nr:T7SS effector LXG polymorphic toxin [Granulicatella adiacens]UAK93080.1 glycohydrolase toxin TNT-related protein [Granulicatella adiacens]UWP37929.1 T7SS effector LXG polymorphic toxin [Granulicatella adiacens ATCC 49175]